MPRAPRTIHADVQPILIGSGPVASCWVRASKALLRAAERLDAEALTKENDPAGQGEAVHENAVDAAWDANTRIIPHVIPPSTATDEKEPETNDHDK